MMKIPKKSGGVRVIHNPDQDMRLIQYKILNYLLNQVPLPEYIYGFEKAKSVPLMAALHVGKRRVISLDIKDFFPSIHQHHLKTAFQKMGIGDTPSSTLSELCTYKWFVPQGALTSPKISNVIVAGSFGPPIKEFCDANALTLTIYADDITISYNREFTDSDQESEFSRKIVGFVRQTLQGFGFRLNREKVKIMPVGKRHWVCGAVVNQKVNLLKKDRLALRALVHNCVVHGVEHEAQKSDMDTLSFIRKYLGKLNWFCQLNPDAGSKLKAPFKELIAPLIKMYPDFEIDKGAYCSSTEIPVTDVEYATAF